MNGRILNKNHMDKLVAVHTLGCKVNQIESEEIKERFRQNGYRVGTTIGDSPDIYVINTCSVTHVSDRKSRALIRRLIRNYPAATIVVTGCITNAEANQLKAIEGIDIIISNAEKSNIVAIVSRWIENPRNSEVRISCQQSKTIEPVFFESQQDRQRGFVKIQDGCESNCTYCIVPQTRGPVRSKDPHDIIKEILHLEHLGYQEIVFTGIHIGNYGQDLAGWDLLKLLLFVLDKVTGKIRFRLGSIEPLEMSRDIIDLIKTSGRICRHLHIPLQSGSDRILKAMNRHYSVSYYSDLIDMIHAELPGAAICTDIIVGFPDEDEEDYQATEKLIRKKPFSELHVFKYSPRPGTAASTFENQVPDSAKNLRSAALMKLSAEKNQDFRKSQVNKKLDLLVEKKIAAHRYLGTSDNYMQLEFSCLESYIGHVIPVKMVDLYEAVII